MKTLKTLAKAVAAAAVVAGATSASALTVNFYNGSNLFATMETSGGTDFDLHFVGTGYAGAFINDLLMAGPGGTFANLTDSSVVSSITSSYSAAGFVESGDTFNWRISFPTSGAGGGAGRLTAGEHALFSITDTDPSVWDFNQLHVNAWDGVRSIRLDGCIDGTAGCDGGGGGGGGAPEPGTLALLGLAGVVGGLVRRRRTTA